MPKRIARAVIAAAVASTAVMPVSPLTQSVSALVSGEAPASSCGGSAISDVAGFNVVAGGDYTLNNDQARGRVLVGGDASLSSWNVGESLPADRDRFDLQVAGSIDAVNGQVANGSISYGATASATMWAPNGVIVNEAPATDPTALVDEVAAVLDGWSEVETSGSVEDVNPWWTTLRFLGDEPEGNVFRINSETLSSAKQIQVRVPTGATALIIVDGESFDTSVGGLTSVQVWNGYTYVQLGNPGSPEDSAIRGRLAWAFPDATVVGVGPNLAWEGSVFAPHADVTVAQSTDFRGAIVGQTVSQLGTVSNFPLASDACLPTSTAGCSGPTVLGVDALVDGQTVDTTEAGTGTGSFFLEGRAPAGTTSVKVEVEGEIGSAAITETDCDVLWSIESIAVESAIETYSVTSSGPVESQTVTIDLNVIAPSEDDTLVTPVFAETPQLQDQLVSYDEATGVMVFGGDVSQSLRVGSGLVGVPSALTPDGYLRIALGASFDGANTLVMTRQAGFTEYIRQIDFSFSKSPDEVETLDFEDVPATSDAVPFRGLRGGPSGSLASLPGNLAMPPVQATEVTDSRFEFTIDVNLNPGFDVDIDVVFGRDGCRFCFPTIKVNRFFFEATLEIDASAEVTLFGGLPTSDTIPFGPEYEDFRFGRLFIPVPPAGVTLDFEIDSQLFFDYKFDLAAQLSYGATLTITAGYEFLPDGSGRGTYSDASFDGGFDPDNLFKAGAVFSVAVGVEIEIQVLFWGLAGVELEATPRLEAKSFVDLTEGSLEIPVEVALVVPFSAGVEIEIKLGIIELEADFANIDFLELSKTLFEFTFLAEPENSLIVAYSAPPGVFPGQVFRYELQIFNSGDEAATDVDADVVLPQSGTFIGVEPSIGPVFPVAGSTIQLSFPDIPAGESATATVTWFSTSIEEAPMTSTAQVTSGNNLDIEPVEATVSTGRLGRCNPCGVAANGVGLRNRSEGTIGISGIPSDAVVTRAVLTWSILHDGSTPSDSISFNGTPVRADVAAAPSGTLCWGDTSTIGYAADVTQLVNSDGNGNYVVSDPVQGSIRPDADPGGSLPFTDGASLVVFYVSGLAENQILADFTYNTNTNASRSITRTFDGITGAGGFAMLTLSGPDGQAAFNEVFTITGAGDPIVLTDTWDGSDSQSGPQFSNGNLWDTDTYSVESVLPPGQTTLTFEHIKDDGPTGDCIGISAAVLEVQQPVDVGPDTGEPI